MSQAHPCPYPHLWASPRRTHLSVLAASRSSLGTCVERVVCACMYAYERVYVSVAFLLCVYTHMHVLASVCVCVKECVCACLHTRVSACLYK
jgi:hypothetical protein